MTDVETGDRRGDGDSSLFVDRPVLTMMITLAIVLVGVIAFANLPLRFAPEGLSESRINIWVPVSQGRTPFEVEDKIAKPFEDELRTIAGVQEVTSESRSDRAIFRIKLDPGMDPTLAAAEVRDRVQRARLRWPSDVDRFFTWREDASSVPLAFFQILTPEYDSSWDFRIDKVVKPRTEAVDGVGRVEIWGLLDETIRIWFDREKLVAHRADFYQLIERLSRDNFIEPTGEIDDGAERLMLRVDNKFRDLDEIRAYPVRPGLALSDIARIERVPAIRDSLSRFNQKYTHMGMVYAAAGTNPVEASDKLRAVTEELEADPRLEGLEFQFFFDQGAMITDSLETLLSTSLQGGALALLALFLFLRNALFTVAIGLAIPLALLMVGGWLFFAGESLNLLTMAGMTLGVGMVVDNSVVVLENIRRMREQGMPLRTACIRGPREVGLAVSMATLTTVVVILPMVFIGDPQARTSLGAVGIPLSVALVGSLLVSLMLLPSGLRHFSGKRAMAAPRATPPASRFSPVALLLGFNRRLLRLSLRHRFVASLVGVLCVYSCTIPASNLEFSGAGSSPFRRGEVTVKLRLPRGLGLQEVENEVLYYEDFALSRRDEWRVDNISSRFNRRSASIEIHLDDDITNEETETLRDLIEEEWPRRPGVEVRLSESGGGPGGGNDSSEEEDERSFVLRLYGRDSQYLMNLARTVRAEVAQLEEVVKAEIPRLDDSEEVVVHLDRDRMEELSVRAEVLQGTIASGLQGRVLTEFEEQGRDTRLIAEFDSEHNPSLLDLKETEVFARGDFQRLSDMSEIRFSQALGSVSRTDGRINVTIVGRRAVGVGPAALSEKLGQVMQRHPLPRGYSWSDESQFVESRQEMSELMSAMYLGVTLVFLLMGVLFESVILPLAILFTVPFALLGAFWSLFAFYGMNDPMAIIGMILLCGIVVNNGIVLLDCIARLRAEGMSREEAILEGTRRRLRPIVMTAATTIVGLLPMALFGESTGQGLSYVSLSITVAGGLALCTVFTACVVPLAYTFMDDLSDWLKATWTRASTS